MLEKESQIITGIKKGNEDAYRQLFEQYYTQLTAFVCKYNIDIDSAREIVQNLFIHLYEIRESLVISTSLKSYLYQSARNRTLNQIKQNAVREMHLKQMNFINETEAEIENKIRETELEAKIYSVVSELPNQCRKIFKMSRADGKSNKEIAEILNISKRTVETQISKALKILRTNLGSLLQLIIWILFN